MLIAFWGRPTDRGDGVPSAGCLASQCSGMAFRPHLVLRQGGDLLACSAGGVRVGSGAAGVRCGGEGFSPLPDHLWGDGFSGDPSIKAPLEPLAPLSDHHLSRQYK